MQTIFQISDLRVVDTFENHFPNQRLASRKHILQYKQFLRNSDFRGGGGGG